MTDIKPKWHYYTLRLFYTFNGTTLPFRLTQARHPTTMLSQIFALLLLTTSSFTIASPIGNPQPIDSILAKPVRDSHALFPIQHYESQPSTPIEPDRPFHWTRNLLAAD
jgi:hypothetical protein